MWHNYYYYYDASVPFLFLLVPLPFPPPRAPAAILQLSIAGQQQQTLPVVPCIALSLTTCKYFILWRPPPLFAYRINDNKSLHSGRHLSAIKFWSFPPISTTTRTPNNRPLEGREEAKKNWRDPAFLSRSIRSPESLPCLVLPLDILWSDDDDDADKSSSVATLKATTERVPGRRTRSEHHK